MTPLRPVCGHPNPHWHQTIAYGMAASQGADTVAIAVHGGDHFIYPDCRPDFIEQFAKMQKMALDGYADIDLYSPFLNGSKADIVGQPRPG